VDQKKPSGDPHGEQDATVLDDGQRRDKLLLRLLKTPPQPRPKRERDKKKPTRTSAKRAKVDKASR
jgi:hypothetical protein